MLFIINFLAGVILGAGLFLVLRKLYFKKKEQVAKDIIKQAEEKAQIIIQEAEKKKDDLLKDLRNKEENLHQKETFLDEREKNLQKLQRELENEKLRIEELTQNLKRQRELIEKELAIKAEMTKEEAKEKLFEHIKMEHKEEILYLLTKLTKERMEMVEDRAKELIIQVLPRYARSVISELTTTVVHLSSEDLKGRIIGKEGRNIKLFENLVGVELIIDETPEVVTISSFDPIRREIAKITLEKLIKDGRINAVTIEEKYKEAKQELEQMINEYGKNAAYDLGIVDLPSEIHHLLGRLKFRYSYGQNVLQHSIEVATFARMIAEELGLNAEIAKRGGFLHDIGKAVSHEIEGSHVEIGIKILEKYGIDEKVILAMRSHHETYPFSIPEAYVVLTADIISAGRPGARREAAEVYIKRVKELEDLAMKFNGVEKAFAIAGGRELRVLVKTEEVDDLKLYELAKEIARKISQEIRFPGEIKVVAIRETRAVEYAR